MRRRSKWLTLSALLVVMLACNLPRAQPTEPPADGSPSPTLTPYVPRQEETATPPPVVASPTATPASTVTTIPTPTPTPTPGSLSTPPPTPTAAVVEPLDFPEPRPEDVTWQPRSDGRYTVTLTIHIKGGMPPFTVHHDLDTFETSERDYPIVFVAAGCSALVHTITVESADGQSVARPYWIPAPWCVTPSS